MGKITKRLRKSGTAFLIALTVMFGTFTQDIYCETEEYDNAERSMQAGNNHFYYRQLSPAEQKVYNAMYSNIANFISVFSVHCQDGLDLERIYNAMLCDHPEIFWTDGIFQYPDPKEHSVTFRPDYSCPRKQVQLEQALIRLDTLSYIGRSKLRNASDYTKILQTYKYVISTLEYDTADENICDNQEIDSAFIRRKTVCTGYAKMMKYLLDSLGVESYIVIGTAGDSTQAERHTWNIVRCNGSYYHLDATWDDGEDQYHYFLLSDEEIFRDHQPDNAGFTYPACG